MFITPEELTGLRRRHGLDAGELVGLAPRRPPLSCVRQLVAARRGLITYGELSRRLDMGRVQTLSLSDGGGTGVARTTACALLALVMHAHMRAGGGGDFPIRA
jgi:hypothetical protein